MRNPRSKHGAYEGDTWRRTPRLTDYLGTSLLACVFPAKRVHEALDAHGCNSQRIRRFPAVAGVYYTMSLSLYPHAAYEAVFSATAQGLA